MRTGKTWSMGDFRTVKVRVWFMASQDYHPLADGKLNEVGLIVDVQLGH